jgi:nucleotide-binding universal stress UspA family protein
MYTYLNLLVTAPATPLAQQLIEAVAGEAGKGTLSVPLVPVGSPPGTPATWYGASGAIGSELVQLLRDAQALAEAAGIDLSQAELLLSQADITEIDAEPWAAVLERLGLERQQEAL